jgi:AmiR/NasT family two-component response regulator
MERYTTDTDGAFAFLVRTAQTSNARLQDVAEEIVVAAARRRADQNE